MLCPRVLSTAASLVLLATSLAKSVLAHSWIDCIDHNYDVVYTKSDDWVRDSVIGQGACEGYAYKYPGRGERNGAAIDLSWKIDATKLKDDSAQVCQYKQSDGANYNEWRRPVHATPGDELYLGYMPNGHIIRDEDGVKSTWGVYWSGVAGRELTKPSELTRDRLVDAKLNSVDDGNCGMTDTNDARPSGRAGDLKPCVGNFSIPSTATPGRYQMIWYWTAYELDGDTAPENSAAYTSCFDVIIDEVPQLESSGLVDSPERCGVAADTLLTMHPQAYPSPEFPPTPAPTSSAPPPSVPTLTPYPTPVPVVPTTTPPPPPPVPTRTAPPLSMAVRVVTPSSFAASTPQSSFSAPLVAVTYNGLGGSGLYGKVTAMRCPSSDTCTQSDFAVNGPIAPFDEDLTLALRGPLDIDGISVFTSSNAKTWSRASSYSKPAGSSENMVFLNNKGDPLKSGVFDFCQGNSQSFATSDGKTPARSASSFSGVLADQVEVNIMSSTSCAQSGINMCGVTRGVAHEGWKGNNKIFMVKATMPNAPSGGQNVPAIWLLNGQIVRTAQYGCNCRGLGDHGQWKGGCGEFDVAEALHGDTNALTSTIYSFKGSRGTNGYAQRPVDTPVVFVVILTEQTTTGSTTLGMAQILLLRPEDVDMTTPPSNEQVQQWLTYRNGMQVDFDI